MTLIAIFLGFIAVAEFGSFIMSLRHRPLVKNIEILQENIKNLQAANSSAMNQLEHERADYWRERAIAEGRIERLEAMIRKAEEQGFDVNK